MKIAAIRRSSLSRVLTSLLLSLFGLSITSSAGSAITWVENTFDDFADGRLDASGQNLYVSRDGTIRNIHRFDLNQDGHIDLVFNSTHDSFAFIPASLAGVNKEGRIHQSELVVEGSLRVEVADLNRDGYHDLVFLPNASGLQHPRRFVTIAWGGKDGWPAMSPYTFVRR